MQPEIRTANSFKPVVRNSIRRFLSALDSNLLANHSYSLLQKCTKADSLLSFESFACAIPGTHRADATKVIIFLNKSSEIIASIRKF